jgi:NitT/TauT family transport system substrate-binding protein
MRVGSIRSGFAGVAAAGCALLTIFLAPAFAQTALKLTLDGRIDLSSAPFFLALERGYFKAEGLDVTIEPAANGAEAMARMANGGYDIGFGDINALLRYDDQSPASFRVVFVLHNRPAYAIIGRKSRGVAAPADLEGKRLGAPAAEPATAAWTAFAKVNGIDTSKVRAVNVGLPVREPMLAAGEVDAVTGTSYVTPIALREKGVPADDITTLLMADYRLRLYGASVFVNAKILPEKSDAIRGFLRALTKGVKDTLSAPEDAVAAIMRRSNGNAGNRKVELERLQVLTRDSIATPEVKANGLGGMDTGRFGEAIEQLEIGYTFKTKPKFADVFDGSMLPPAAERRID